MIRKRKRFLLFWSSSNVLYRESYERTMTRVEHSQNYKSATFVVHTSRVSTTIDDLQTTSPER